VPRRVTPRTVGEWWAALTKQFARARLHFGHGTGNARDEAAWLVCHVFRIPFAQLPISLDREASAGRARRLRTLATRRIRTRAPLAHILHEAWLADHRFYVDGRVIVPRSHIAELLRESLAPWVRNPTSIKRVLDLGTGSGCLAILAALAFPKAAVDASDISSAALAVAHRNRADYGLRGRIRLVRSDLFAELADERYDLILSNPPYVTTAAMRALPAEYRHEPRRALAGGPDGLEIVREILDVAYEHLVEDGLLVIEVGDSRRAVQRAYPKLALTWLATSGAEDCVFMVASKDLVDARMTDSPD
jgi:ribosomal protein L3 glutamine methyltransferase